MNQKTITKIALISILSSSFLFAQEKPQKLTAQQLQACINKVEKIKDIKELMNKRTKDLNELTSAIISFEESSKAIDKYIEAYQKNYSNYSQELIYKEFELEEYSEDSDRYKDIQKSIQALEKEINRYTQTEYFQGLVTTKKTLTDLIKNGKNYFFKEGDKIAKDNKKLKLEEEKILAECVTNKTIDPEVEKQVCEQNKHSFLCSKYK